MNHFQSSAAKMIAIGLASKEIAPLMSVTVKHVNNMRSAIFRHYKVNNAVQLAHRLLANGEINNLYGVTSNSIQSKSQLAGKPPGPTKQLAQG